MKESLLVEQKDGKVYLHITIDNPGDKPVYVPATIAADDVPTGSWFKLTAEGAPVDYVGMMVKRGAPTADDYVEVAPHAQLKNIVDITRSYAWKAPGTSYTLAHTGHWVADPARLAETHALIAAPATFRR